MVGKFFDRLTVLNAAEATVISFLLASLIGGSLLFYTEKDRMVTSKVPVLQEVTVNASAPLTPNVDPKLFQSNRETHTVVQTVTYKGENFVDTLFNAISALCVTGLISTDFASFTVPGQIITMILIQIGGLGVILFTSIFAFAIVRGLSERSSFKQILSNVLDTSENAAGTMLKNIVGYTFFFEFLGFLIMGVHLQWFVDPSILNDGVHQINPWWFALFHSISAFNNAGFSLMQNNLANFVKDSWISLTVAFQIILGGIGYPVLIAVHAGLRKKWMSDDKKQKKLDHDVKDVVASPLQTKVAIYGTLIALAVGTVLIGYFEWNNPGMQGLSLWQKIMAAFFQAVVPRTAGFNTLDYSTFAPATIFLTMILMFIGACPAGTGGGIKISTAAVLYGYIKDWFAAPGKPTMLFGEKVSRFAVSHAVRLVVAVAIFITITTMLILIDESKFMSTPDGVMSFQKVFFEIFSAFGTVGNSQGYPGAITSLTAIFSTFSKYVIMSLMLFGRLGGLTILAALPWKKTHAAAPMSEDFEGAQKLQIG